MVQQSNDYFASEWVKDKANYVSYNGMITYGIPF